MRGICTVLGQMRTLGAVLGQVIFALAVHALSTARVYAMLILSALPAEMSLLLANEANGKFETVAVTRLRAHPYGVACERESC
jgi:hypothetical protein